MRRRGRCRLEEGGEGGGGVELEVDQSEVSGVEKPVGGEAEEQVKLLLGGGGEGGAGLGALGEGGQAKHLSQDWRLKR